MSLVWTRLNSSANDRARSGGLGLWSHKLTEWGAQSSLSTVWTHYFFLLLLTKFVSSARAWVQGFGILLGHWMVLGFSTQCLNAHYFVPILRDHCLATNKCEHSLSHCFRSCRFFFEEARNLKELLNNFIILYFTKANFESDGFSLFIISSTEQPPTAANRRTVYFS